MVVILHRGTMNAKIIVHKAKYGVSVIMDPQARCVLYRMIPKWVHMFYKFLVSNYPRFFESIHTLLDAHVDPPLFFDQCGEVGGINYFLSGNFQCNEHKSVPL